MLGEQTNKMIDNVALWLGAIGALNWGLTLWKWNLVEMLLGVGNMALVVYGLVGLSGLWIMLRQLKLM